MDPWYKVVVPRKEVREGRSFNPDEFAIHLEQVIAGTAPEDYKDPVQFFARTCFTRALREHTGMVLRRLAGNTSNTAPVMTLVTQFGGGKTHTLCALYHLATSGTTSSTDEGVRNLISDAGLDQVPSAKVGAFVGNAWDPQEGRETPWIDIARQLAGEDGVRILGPDAKDSPPGTEALQRVFQAANAPVLVLFDEVLNFINRHRKLADPFLAFIQNLTVAMTATTHGAAVISLPRSQVEMTDWDMQWQERITKVVRRVAKDLFANDETEVSEVVRRRLFDSLGTDRVRQRVSKAYADWCFERRAELPSEWTAVDTASTEAKAREHLRSRFEACYPFHPGTLSVFQRKWQSLSQYQQTRGTLAMFAQWISWAFKEGYSNARREPLITLGSAPLEVPDFLSVVLGQLGESRLSAAIDTDICGELAHARALDADSKGVLRDIHRRVGKTILFESSGGQVDKVAHLPELRFDLGETDIDTTSVDNAAIELQRKSYFFRKVGADGFKVSHQATIKKVVNGRRASLDDETDIRPAMRSLAQKEFSKGATIPLVLFPADGTAVQDTPRLTLVVLDPESEWVAGQSIEKQIQDWSKQRGQSPRLFPGSLIWCIKKPGRDLRGKVELGLSWSRVAREIADGSLGGDFEPADRAEVKSNLSDAEEAAKDEVWGGYRFVVITDSQEQSGLKVIDLGAGHSSGGDTLSGRVITALKSQALLNESIGAGYLERNWPPALKDSGAWPLASLRQSFLNGSLTRLVDPDVVLKSKIVEFIGKGEFGLASGQKTDGTYGRIWFEEQVSADEVTFEQGMYLLLKATAGALKAPKDTGAEIATDTETGVGTDSETTPEPEPPSGPTERILHISGKVPPEVWNRLGTRLIPKLRSGKGLSVKVEFDMTVEANLVSNAKAEINQVIEDLELTEDISINESSLPEQG